jgi:hypothetical protein
MLRSVPLDSVLPLKPGTLTITMSVGQWDTLLAIAYDTGVVLLELDGEEQPVAAYQRESYCAYT